MSDTLTQKLETVRDTLRGCQRVIVAFSGGVDSTLLLKLARQTLERERVLAVTADSPSLAHEDLVEACRLAQRLDVEHLVIDTAEVEHPAYQANSPSRCYFCKQELFARLEQIAFERNIPTILYGAIGDDRLDERPGAVAATDYGVRAPLREAGLSKPEVRHAARALGLPNWDRPQNACLSSRIPHGLDVTPQKLQVIEQAEHVLKTLGFRLVRVRHLGDHARIEVGQDEVDRFQDQTLCQAVAQQLMRLGFRSVGVDRSGYRPGGANQQATEELPVVTSDQ